MSEMVELVVEAVRAKQWERGLQLGKTELEEDVRAAIAAMREPTGEMIKSGCNYSKLSATPEGMWRAMIDEMLKNGHP